MNNDNVKETKKDLMNILIPELEKCDEEDKTLLKGIAIGMRIMSGKNIIDQMIRKRIGTGQTSRSESHLRLPQYLWKQASSHRYVQNQPL